ncbi:MAG: 50S ribosomal protein L23 [Candidatus Nealsonbacteria bacterium]
MGLLNIFKKGKEPKRKEEIRKAKKESKGSLIKPVDKVVKKSAKDFPVENIKVGGEKIKPIEKTKQVSQKITVNKKFEGIGYQVLHSPHVTEKATDLTEKNQYIFKVWPRSNKNIIKRAVEKTYGVDVVGVRVINVHRKKRNLGRKQGWTKGYKKAIVEIKKGQKIEILPR